MIRIGLFLLSLSVLLKAHESAEKGGRMIEMAMPMISQLFDRSGPGGGSGGGHGGGPGGGHGGGHGGRGGEHGNDRHKNMNDKRGQNFGERGHGGGDFDGNQGFGRQPNQSPFFSSGSGLNNMQGGYGGGPPNMQGGYGGGPPNMQGGYGGGPPNIQGGYGGGPPNMQGSFGGGPPNMQGGFGGGPPNMQGGYGGGQNNMQSGFASGPPNMQRGFGGGPPNMQGSFGGGSQNIQGIPSQQPNYNSYPGFGQNNPYIEHRHLNTEGGRFPYFEASGKAFPPGNSYMMNGGGSHFPPSSSYGPQGFSTQSSYPFNSAFNTNDGLTFTGPPNGVNMGGYGMVSHGLPQSNGFNSGGNFWSSSPPPNMFSSNEAFGGQRTPFTAGVPSSNLQTASTSEMAVESPTEMGPTVTSQLTTVESESYPALQMRSLTPQSSTSEKKNDDEEPKDKEVTVKTQ